MSEHRRPLPKPSTQIVARRIVVAASADRNRHAPGELMSSATARLPAPRLVSLVLPVACAMWSLVMLLSHS